MLASWSEHAIKYQFSGPVLLVGSLTFGALACGDVSVEPLCYSTKTNVEATPIDCLLSQMEIILRLPLIAFL